MKELYFAIIMIIGLNLCDVVDGHFPDYKMNIVLLVLVGFIIIIRKNKKIKG